MFLTQDILFMPILIHQSASILPIPRIHPLRRMLSNMLCHHLQQFAGGHRLPAMAFHGAAVPEGAFVMRILCMPQKILELVHRKVQVKVVGIAYVHMQFVNQFRPKRGPVFREIIPQIVAMFAGIVHGVAVYFASKVIP